MMKENWKIGRMKIMNALIDEATIHDITIKRPITSKEMSGIVKAMGNNGGGGGYYKLLQSKSYSTVAERKIAMKRLLCVWGKAIVCFHIEIK